MFAANDNGQAEAGLRFLSVCSGIEAASAAWKQLGWQAVAFSEIEKFPSAVLAYRYPSVPNLGDFTKIQPKTLGRVDILCGGTPCQAFSVAGLRMSLADARGNLSLEFVRLAHELAACNGLRNAVWENVVGVLSTKDNAFGCFLAGLVGADDAVIPGEKPADGKSNKHWKWRKGGRYAVLDDEGEKTGEYEIREPWHTLSWPRHGMVSGPKGRAAWAVKDAQFFGVAQRRRRVLVVADFGNGADPAAVLFEPESVCRHPPSRGEAGKDVAPTISARTKGGGGLGTDFDLDGGLISHPLLAKGNSSHDDSKETYVPVDYAPEIARCVATREGSSQDYETTTMVAVGTAYSIARDALDRSGEGASGTPGDRSGLGVLEEITQTIKAKGPNAVCVTGDVSHALTAEGHDASEDGSGRRAPIIAFDWYASASQGMPINEFSPPLKTTMQPAVAFAQNSRDEVRLQGGDGQIVGSLAAQPGMKQTTYIATSSVRRLKPMECERLQGFADNYTRIPLRSYKAKKVTRTRPEDMWECIDGGWWLMAADGPRYKALGNSWAVPKFTWLGQRIQMLMPANDNQTPHIENAS